MKITIELEEIKVAPDKILNRESYDKSGIYLVNDGIAWMLVVVEETLVMSSTALPSKKILEQYIKTSNDKVKEDLLGNIDNRLKLITDKIEDLPEQSSSGCIDAKELCSIIAVSQKPELLKEL